LALVLLGVAAFGLSACGRAGPLELPPGPSVGPSVGASPAASAASTASAAPPPSGPSAAIGGPAGTTVAGGMTPEAAQKNGFDAYGNPVAPAGNKKSFLLDFLLQ
jgi:predicted small lipoprotein YifL